MKTMAYLFPSKTVATEVHLPQQYGKDPPLGWVAVLRAFDDQDPNEMHKAGNSDSVSIHPLSCPSTSTCCTRWSKAYALRSVPRTTHRGSLAAMLIGDIGVQQSKNCPENLGGHSTTPHPQCHSWSSPMPDVKLVCHFQLSLLPQDSERPLLALGLIAGDRQDHFLFSGHLAYPQGFPYWSCDCYQHL